jgi:peptide methionine sulfoxide reductase msrA/msrB
VAGLRFILEQFFQVIDPLSVNQQGNDVGVQYRTGIYWVDPADQVPTELELATLERRLGQPVAIECGPLRGFSLAEDYHQDYLLKNPGGYCHISPAAMAAARAARPIPAFGLAANPPSADGPNGTLVADSVDPAGAADTAGAVGAADPAAVVAVDPVGAADPARLAALSPLQYAVTQQGSTELPFTGEYDQTFAPGIYVDISSGQPLFVSSQKFDSGCGWPAFARPITSGLVQEVEDRSYGRVRTEVRSAGSGAHLGHVFADGPADMGGLRYCVNSAALEFVPLEEMASRGYEAFLPLIEEPQ